MNRIASGTALALAGLTVAHLGNDVCFHQARVYSREEMCRAAAAHVVTRFHTEGKMLGRTVKDFVAQNPQYCRLNVAAYAFGTPGDDQFEGWEGESFLKRVAGSAHTPIYVDVKQAEWIGAMNLKNSRNSGVLVLVNRCGVASVWKD